jgi:lipid-binding SYLF domain-containing protein
VVHRLVLLLAVLVVTAGCARSLPPHSEAEVIVEKARITVITLKERETAPAPSFRESLKTAKGILIFPDVFKAAVGVGGQGGSGVLLVRDQSGTWSYPAFFRLSSGSLGPQLGASSTQLVFILRSEGAVRSVISDQFQIGGDMQWTFGSYGSGLVAGTTTHAGADVVGFAVSEGVFGGFSLQAGSVARRVDLNEAYYGRKVTTRQIVLENQAFNLHADPLRQSLVIQ